MRVYIAGPYSADAAEAVEMNVQAAIDAWHRLRDAGLTPFCPHLSHYLHGWRFRSYEDWMAWDLDWLETCDALVRLDGESSGADREVAAAERMGMPVYTVEEAIEELGTNGGEGA